MAICKRHDLSTEAMARSLVKIDLVARVLEPYLVQGFVLVASARDVRWI